MLRKTLLLMAGVALGALGLIGLVLPFMPGVLFLVAAAVCLSLASRRLGARLEARLAHHPRYREALGHWRSARHLPRWQRARLGFWLAARCMIPGRL